MNAGCDTLLLAASLFSRTGDELLFVNHGRFNVRRPSRYTTLPIAQQQCLALSVDTWTELSRMVSVDRIPSLTCI